MGNTVPSGGGLSRPPLVPFVIVGDAEGENEIAVGGSEKGGSTIIGDVEGAKVVGLLVSFIIVGETVTVGEADGDEVGLLGASSAVGESVAFAATVGEDVAFDVVSSFDNWRQ
mmetsp:Transcript_19014/g.24186  ORF Transcript_19014/g.24186 Transcript_19014/m.24186 type:complete len:113 (+) Transcript_19014:1287-1625(+)